MVLLAGKVPTVGQVFKERAAGLVRIQRKASLTASMAEAKEGQDFPAAPAKTGGPDCRGEVAELLYFKLPTHMNWRAPSSSWLKAGRVEQVDAEERVGLAEWGAQAGMGEVTAVEARQDLRGPMDYRGA